MRDTGASQEDPVKSDAARRSDAEQPSLRAAARGIMFAVTTGWAIYLVSQFAVAVAAQFGLDGGLEGGGEMSDLSDGLSLALHLIDLVALSSYALAAFLIARDRWQALPVFALAFTLDFGVWIFASAVYAGYELTSLMHTSLVNWAINIILLCTLLGLFLIYQDRVRPGSR
jgi:hypothetical protein